LIKPPYTKWINDIKAKLGFTRTMTASGEDVVDAVNKQSQQIRDLNDYTEVATCSALGIHIKKNNLGRYTIYGDGTEFATSGWTAFTQYEYPLTITGALTEDWLTCVLQKSHGYAFYCPIMIICKKYRCTKSYTVQRW